MPTTRFVILHHREASGEHWDLMIEQSDALATWRLERLPRPQDADAIVAARIADHRKAYLTYEGPLTKDRGSVTRVAGGACDILAQGDNAWRLNLHSDTLNGPVKLTRIEEDRWEYVSDAESHS